MSNDERSVPIQQPSVRRQGKLISDSFAKLLIYGRIFVSACLIRNDPALVGLFDFHAIEFMFLVMGITEVLHGSV
jgi:hypothetical protein